MEEKTLQILWGFLIYIFSIVLGGIGLPIFRSIQHLSYIQTYAFLTLGEVVSCLPLVPYAVRHWNITTWKEWIAYLYMACISAFHIIIVIYCSYVMPFGDFAALRSSGILLAPVIAAVLDKRCVKFLDVAGVVVAVVGTFLITSPTFLLRLISPSNSLPSMDIPALAYCLGLLLSIYLMTQPFLIAIFSHIHWSCFILLRTVMAVLFSIAYLSLTSGWVLKSPVSVFDLLTSFAVGVILNILRASQLIALDAWNQLSPGLAGFMGNLITTLFIPLMLFFGYIFYGEMVTLIEGVGIAIIFISIISIATIKFKFAEERDSDYEKSVDVKNEDSENFELLTVK